MSTNFTGSKRILHDCCVDFYNVVQKWTRLTIEMHSIILNICNLKRKEFDEELYVEDQLKDTQSETDFLELESLCSQLHFKLKNQEAIADKMLRMSQRLKSLHELTEQSMTESDIFFKTWPLSRFVKAADTIQTMYRKELKTKQNIAKEICTLTKKSQLIFFEACWKHEPSINREELDRLLTDFVHELEISSQLS